MEIDPDYPHKKEYEEARAFVRGLELEMVLKPWEELEEAEKQAIRESNQEYWKKTQELGDKIRQGVFG